MLSRRVRGFARGVPLTNVRGRCGRPEAVLDGDCDEARTLLQLCVDRHYVSAGQRLQLDPGCSYGPLGVELRRNLLDQWWDSMSRSSAQIFRISTMCSSSQEAAGLGQLKIIDTHILQQILSSQEQSKDELIQKIHLLQQRSPSVRTNFLQAALKQFVPSLALVNRKLPFGLAESGVCFQSSEGCPAEVTQTSLVWFCSPRTSSQWLDHWTRRRLKWWKKFALSPFNFSSSDVPVEELDRAASRGVRIVYSFPWGQETLETLWNRGDTELLQTHQGAHSNLQFRDGRKSVPHVVSVTANMDRGVTAYLYNSLQQLKRENSKQKLQHRKVLKLHPVLAPVKVALDIGRGATMELRQVCEGLMLELRQAKISVWPGYMDTVPTSMDQLNNKYDEMGVLFTVTISENTLESGLLQVRSRDTTIREIVHISEVKHFLCRHITAAAGM